MEEKKKKTALGKVDVTSKAMRIQDLGDKVGFAIKQFELAQDKFEAGKDSYKEWKNIIKLLNIQIKDIQHFKAVAHHNMGVVLAGRKNFKKAVKKFNEAVELDPQYALAWYNMAVAYKLLNKMVKAKECIAKAKELGYAGRASTP
jgi:tetratricopeptide (TPR) repeat protein